MPLPKRTIEPTHVARSVYQHDEQHIELETVTNTTLTNIIRQLSSISKHAEDVFGELARDVGNIGDRANSLQARIDRLAIKVTQLDSTGEEISLTDIQLKKAFKSIKMFDQQIFSRETMPTPMLETYSQCDKPPPLDKLNVYREDGKDAIKFYTDPNFFFDLWRQEMLKDTERAMHDKGKKTHRPKQDCNISGSNAGNASNNISGNNSRGNKKRVRQPHNTREKQRQIAIGHGETLMPNNVIYRSPQCDESGYSSMSVYDIRPSRPNSIEITRNYQGEVVDGTENNIYGMVNLQQNDHQQYVQANQYQGLVNQNMLSQYEESIYNSQSVYGYAGNALSPEGVYGPGTPTRNKIRPTHPPPAPPPNTGVLSSSNANTPARGKNILGGRDNLPPPPPVPDCMVPAQNNISSQINNSVLNGNMAVKFLVKTNSRAGSPQMLLSTNVQDANAMVLAQLNNQMNNPNSSLHDLPPPPPVPDQHSTKMSPPNAAPPPPPPPPPFEGSSSTQMQSLQTTNNKISNIGDINNKLQSNGIIGNNTKKSLPSFHDTRNDLMKAIRDGIKLRKVEKTDQIENIKRNVPLNDVASILARRVAIELTDSEDSDSEDDSEVWMENTNETSA
ncbi:WASF1 family protein [Megaselia abdita]